MLNNTHFKQNCRSGCLTTFAVRLYVNYKNVHGYNICILWYFSMKFCSCNNFDALFICKAVGSKWILGGGGGGAGNSGNLGESGGMHPQIILKPTTPEIRLPASWEVIFYRKVHYKLEVWE